MEVKDGGAGGSLEEDGAGAEVGAGWVRARSPRMMTSAWITVRPPRMMFCVPEIWARRETLLPVSLMGGEWLAEERIRSSEGARLARPPEWRAWIEIAGEGEGDGYSFDVFPLGLLRCHHKVNRQRMAASILIAAELFDIGDLIGRDVLRSRSLGRPIPTRLSHAMADCG